MTPRLSYALAALVLFLVEVLIALFVHDSFSRPYVGDMLAIALVYTALRAATPLQMIPALGITLAVALAIEIAQLLNLLDAIGLRGNQVARIVLGGVFDWLDLAAYGAGAIGIIAAEAALRRRVRP